MNLRFIVTVIIYNPKIDVFDRIKIYSDCFEKVLVIDNSDVKNIDFINKISIFDNVFFYDMKGNRGISVALMKSFDVAKHEHFDFILTMDQDTVFSKKAILAMQSIIGKMNQSDIGIFAPNYRKMYYDKNCKIIYKDSHYDSDKSHEILSCMTSGSFISCKILDKLIPLDDYFIAHVDTDICAKVITSGYRILLIGNVFFNQQLGKPMKNSRFNMKFNATNHEPIRYYYMIRNYLYFRRQYKNNKKLKKQIKIMPLKYIFKLVTSETNKIEKVKYSYYGYKDFKKNIMGKYGKKN